MTQEHFDSAWESWMVVMRNVSSLVEKGDLTTALAAVESFSAPEGMPDLRSDVLGFRADLEERLGRVETAKADLLAARSLVAATYIRYVHELSLGSICRRQNQVDEAESWYRTALRTCLEGKNISGGTALKEFLLLNREGTLSTEDQSLWSQVAERSWEMLGLAGRPDLSDLPRVVSAIKEGEARPPRKKP